MLTARQDDAVVVWAPAKVNLFLEVLGKRADGYHEIATLMAAVSLFDTLELKPDHSGRVELACDHPDLGTGPENLVLRAAYLLQEHTGVAHGARLRLTKRIPLAAGLAGGSSDAAATLEGLNRLWRLNLRAEELAQLAARIGSDVAFFLQGPAGWCTGRGEQVTPVRLGGPFWAVLCCPPFGLATAAVYRHVSVPTVPRSGERILDAAARGDVTGMGRELHNRLEAAAEQLQPALIDYRVRLRELGPAGVLLSGSGSTMFALCRDHGEALALIRQLRNRPDWDASLQLYLVRSCS